MQNEIQANEVEHVFKLPFPAPGTMFHKPRILPLADGKIYAADCESQGGTIFVARTHGDGTPDTAFGSDGWIAEHMTSDITNPEVVGLLPRDDGGVLVALSGVDTFGLACFRANGQLDQAFGENGKIIHHIECGESPERPEGMFSQADFANRGKAEMLTSNRGVAALFQADNGVFYGLLGDRFAGQTCALMRFRSDGRLDPEFNGNGIVIINCPSVPPVGARKSANSVVVMSDGGAVVVGTVVGQPARVYFCRFNRDGTINNSFGENGFAIFDSTAAEIPTEYSYQMELNYACNLSNDGVAACGYLTLQPFYNSFGLVICVDSRGRPIDQFNHGKAVRFGVIGESEVKFLFGGIGVQEDESIVACGGANQGGSLGQSILIARFLKDGQTDPGFGDAGHLQVRPYDSIVNYASDLRIDSNGKILVSGAGGPDYGISTWTSYVFRLGD